jgi:hypothetical protein
MAFSVAATTTSKIENYTTPGDVTGRRGLRAGMALRESRDAEADRPFGARPDAASVVS